MKGKAAAQGPLRDFPGPEPESFRARLQSAALEKGALDSVDFALLDSLARHAHRPADSAFLAVTACLLAAVKSGGLRIPLDPAALTARLELFLRGLFPVPAPATEDASTLSLRFAQEFHSHRLAGSYAAVLGEVIPSAPALFLPLLADGGLYFQKHQAAEASVRARLADFLNAPDFAPSAHESQPFLDAVLDTYPLRLSTGALVFDPLQKSALALALRKRFTIISGGPGTGKTSLAANLLRAWTRAWCARPDRQNELPRVRLAAPTGRAAQRLAESLRHSLESVAPDPLMPNPDATADRFVAALVCETLHSLLRYNPGSGEYFHQRNRPLPADLVLIDEVSMVDIFALSRLLEALEPEACLVLLGDMDQLPSVEAGSVLADLIPPTAGGAPASSDAGTSSETGTGAPGNPDHPLRDHIILLERSHRSEAGILQVTQRINAMEGEAALLAMGNPRVLTEAWPVTFLDPATGLKTTPGGGCRMLAPSNHGQTQPSDYRYGWNAWLEAWVDFHYLGHACRPEIHPGHTLATPRSASYASLVESVGKSASPEDRAFLIALAEMFVYLDQARILTLTRKGWHGAESVNRRIGERLAPLWDPRANRSESTASQGFHGSPILILENDYGKGLFNGDVGILLKVQGRALAFFRKAEGYKAFPAAFLPRHETAFAMTVHKSQGSEYDQVLLVLPEAGNRLLYKETLYTALTRARFFAGIYGPREVFLEAVGRKVVRESGLREFLNRR